MVRVRSVAGQEAVGRFIRAVKENRFRVVARCAHTRDQGQPDQAARVLDDVGHIPMRSGKSWPGFLAAIAVCRSLSATAVSCEQPFTYQSHAHTHDADKPRWSHDWADANRSGRESAYIEQLELVEGREVADALVGDLQERGQRERLQVLQVVGDRLQPSVRNVFAIGCAGQSHAPWRW
jgi:hypothetical protein